MSKLDFHFFRTISNGNRILQDRINRAIWVNLGAIIKKINTVVEFTDEKAQDAVGNIFTASSTITPTYNDVTPSMSWAVIANSSVQKVYASVDGASIGSRQKLNFVQGLGVNIFGVDDSTNDRVNLTFQTIPSFFYDHQLMTYAYKIISTMESTETWTGASSTTVDADTTTGEFIAGSQSIKLSNVSSGTGKIQAYRNVNLDLTKFGDTSTASNQADVILLNFLFSDISKFAEVSGSYLQFWFYTDSTDKFAATTGKRARIKITSGQGTASGWNQRRITKNSFEYLNGFTDSDWASIQGMYIYSNTNDTGAYLAFDNFIMLHSSSSTYILLDSSDSTNTDSTSGSVLTLAAGSGISRFKGQNYNAVGCYLIIENAVTNGYGKAYSIDSQTDNTIIVSGTLPTIASSVTWKIVRPIFINRSADNSTYGKTGLTSLTEEDGQLKHISVDVLGASAKLLQVSAFKPFSSNRYHRIKIHFQFRTNSSKQGVFYDYKDTSNYMLCYITKDGSDSTIKIDSVISGSATNLFTSSTFTISDDDEIILFLEFEKNRLSIFKSSVNSYDCTYIGFISYYNETLQAYMSFWGIYSDLEMRPLEVNAGVDIEIFAPKFAKKLSGTFSSSNILTVTDGIIHKTSDVRWKLLSAPAGDIYLSSLSAGSVVFTSSSGSETAQLEVEIFN